MLLYVVAVYLLCVFWFFLTPVAEPGMPSYATSGGCSQTQMPNLETISKYQEDISISEEVALHDIPSWTDCCRHLSLTMIFAIPDYVASFQHRDINIEAVEARSLFSVKPVTARNYRNTCVDQKCPFKP
ncbi:hypothetical protein BJ878DRAFT_477250 [Calycina marina]|uniref:Uncharacterized protein n=1 Tax=Calycina marina TaxID=1763456 RepID=A0A9P8CJJ4_9HELO|nr:hypothetical protein BJ878DRAFT_477250 [Calycina marina]